MAVLALTACARRYRVAGMVISTDPATRTMIVSHREVPGYMPAMVMPFRVRADRDLERLLPGDRVEFRLEVRRTGSVARDLRRSPADNTGVSADGQERFVIPVPAEKASPGDPAPDVELTDQAGRPVRLSEFAGRVVAINFLYTRCPLPEVCPRLAAGFAELQRRFRERMGQDLVLVSVTLDPEHDTPEVLARYAKIWRADQQGWRFLTGPRERVRELAARLGLVFWIEEGVIAHTSVTGVIGRDGRLAALVEGLAYSTRQLGDLVAHQVDKTEDR